MSITVRLWTDADFQNLSTDDNLLTVFFNCRTYSQKELLHLNRFLEKRKTYDVFLYTNDFDYPIQYTVYAVSDTSLRWFLKQEICAEALDISIVEVITTYRKVPHND